MSKLYEPLMVGVYCTVYRPSVLYTTESTPSTKMPVESENASLLTSVMSRVALVYFSSNDISVTIVDEALQKASTTPPFERLTVPVPNFWIAVVTTLSASL